MPVRLLRIISLPVVLIVAAIPLASAGAQEGALETVEVSRLRLPEASAGGGRGPLSQAVDPRLSKAEGPVGVVVRLADAPLSAAVGRSALQSGSDLGGTQQRRYLSRLDADQDRFASRARDLGAEELARLKKALNAVVIRVDASRLEEIANIEGVRSVRPVINYELDLSETVPYIGADEVQAGGFDGAGTRIAVLDTGVDYTHRNLGGPGTQAAYRAAYGDDPADPDNEQRDGLFPTNKVYEGFDFVGEEWTGDPDSPPTAEDSDPIDFEGHGTHVADIAAGRSQDGEHVGVAPGSRVLAVKVCSALGSSCEGVALLKGVDFALDPNRDGDISDAVDVINMSLGSDYGQREDDLSEASANAARLGITVVAAAGNASDNPYIVGSPSSAPEVISVAQTQVPSAVAIPLVVDSPASIAGSFPNTATVDWAPVEDGFAGEVSYVGQGCPAGSVEGQPGADPYLDDPAGKIALIDRGGCTISLKVDRAAEAGAEAVLLANNVPGDAASFGFGGGENFVPTLVITLGTGNLIKENIDVPVNVTVSVENAVPLIGSVVGSSARGPSSSFNAIKPDIGAPGASVSAIVGSGNGEEAFGGTSGASPVVAGTAALLVDAFPGRTPTEIKALLMNTAKSDIETNPAVAPGVLAPITRIGGGEVRVNRALESRTAAWDAEALTGSLSFGYRATNRDITLTKRVLVRNYGNASRTYSIKPEFRYKDDARSGAVTLSAPRGIIVPRQSSRIFDLKMTIDASELPRWTLDGGRQGGNGELLRDLEFDGYINISSRTDNVHLAFQVLPHRAAAVNAERGAVDLENRTGSLKLSNANGATRGRVETFSLTGTSPQIPDSQLPRPGDGFAVTDLKAAGARMVDIGKEQPGIQFAVNTFGRRAHPNVPAEFDIPIDNNRDGTADFVVFNADLGLLTGRGITGQNAVGVFDVQSGEVARLFFTDADLNSANVILTVPLRAVGLTRQTKFDFQVLAFDNLFTGEQTDAIDTMTYTPGTPRFAASGVTQTGIPAGGSDTLNIRALKGGAKASPSQRGFLLLYRDARAGREAELIRVVR